MNNLTVQLNELEGKFCEILEIAYQRSAKNPSNDLDLRIQGVRNRLTPISGYLELIKAQIIDATVEPYHSEILDLIQIARSELVLLLDDENYAGSHEQYKQL